jgi:hypothetical protein
MNAVPEIVQAPENYEEDSTWSVSEEEDDFQDTSEESSDDSFGDEEVPILRRKRPALP